MAWIPVGMASAPTQKQSKGAAFLSRLVSTLVLWGIIAGVLASGHMWGLIWLIAVIAALGAVEFFLLTRSVEGRDARTWSLVVSLGYLAWILVSTAGGSAAWEEGGFLPAVAGMVLVVIGAFVVRLRREIGGPESVLPVAMALLAFCYVPVLFACFMTHLAFLPPGEESASGFWLLLLVVVATKFTDMGAYLVGSLIGRHKAIPHVSPAKSWEGYFGSLFFAVGGAVGVYLLGGDTFAWLGSLTHVVVLSIVMALMAMVGDLAESILKRSLHVKDSGKLLPGIGGVLDLIDSLCFSAPVAYLYLRMFVV